MQATNTKIKVLSFQPFSLYRNGGGSRVLRRLYMTHEPEIHSVVVEDSSGKIIQGEISETIVYASPVRKPWMRWKMTSAATWLREGLFRSYTESKIRKAATVVPFDVIHIVNHGPFSTALCKNDFLKEKDVWVSFHDHYSTCSSFEDAKKLWHTADRRFVISEELGKEYQTKFGLKHYELVTDGVSEEEISQPKHHANDPITVYFAGLLHWDYLPLFKVLADALDALTETDGLKFKMILRGTQPLAFLKDRSFVVEYKTDFVSDNDIKAELDHADILYLPIKFNQRDFYLYSLSTKMISYMGAKGAVLYHGPEESAACKLLVETGAGAICTTNEVADLGRQITSLSKNLHDISKNAKKVVEERFELTKIQNRIWNN